MPSPNGASPSQAQRSWTPAVLKFLKPEQGGGETVDKEITFDFNPKDYSITRAAKWKQNSNKTGLLPAEYNGPVASSITVEMFLDETTLEDGDISKKIKELLKRVNPEPDSVTKNKPMACFVRFIWGTAIEFTGYIDSVAVKYTLFRENGNPVRGTATITMKEFGLAEAAQNPTSGSEPGSRAHRVIAGDTLASIAYREYGNATLWRKVAEANPGVDDPLRLAEGASLLVPPA
jgi:phage tail protein X